MPWSCALTTTYGASARSDNIASTYPGLDEEGWRGHTVPVRDLVTIERWHEGDTAWLRGSYRHGPGGWLVTVRCPGLSWEGDRATGDPQLASVLFAAVAADPEVPPDPAELVARLDRIQHVGRESRADAHRRAHRAWFDRCRVDLVCEPVVSRPPVEDLLAQAADGAVPPLLWQSLWEMGRGLFIASAATEGRFPPHLQGIWTGTWRPPWFGCYTNDENLQMMHWQAVSGNLSPLLAPLRRLIQASRRAWRENAHELFGCAGVLAPLQQGGVNARHQQAEWHAWTGGAGCLALHVWDAWLVDRDDRLLREELLPLLTEILAFYDDFLEHDGNGLRHAVPSISVENQPVGWPGRWAIDATMEIALVREVLRHAKAAATAAGQPIPPAWLRLEGSLPAYRINAAGELAEWIHPAHAEQHRHRHLSPCYPLFPGDECGPQDENLRAAVRRTVLARARVGADSQTGWSYAHMAHIHARLGDGPAVQRCLEHLLRTCTQPNLLTVHDAWRGKPGASDGDKRRRSALQLDALFGATSAIQESMVQSGEDWLRLLPARLPDWRRGSARGLGTRCGVVVDLDWNAAAASATGRLTAQRDCRCTVYTGKTSVPGGRPLALAAGQTWRMSWQLTAGNTNQQELVGVVDL